MAKLHKIHGFLFEITYIYIYDFFNVVKMVTQCRWNPWKTRVPNNLSSCRQYIQICECLIYVFLLIFIKWKIFSVNWDLKIISNFFPFTININIYIPHANPIHIYLTQIHHFQSPNNNNNHHHTKIYSYHNRRVKQTIFRSMLNCVNSLEPQSMNSGIEHAALMISEEKTQHDSRKTNFSTTFKITKFNSYLPTLQYFIYKNKTIPK